MLCFVKISKLEYSGPTILENTCRTPPFSMLSFNRSTCNICDTRNCSWLPKRSLSTNPVPYPHKSTLARHALMDCKLRGPILIRGKGDVFTLRIQSVQRVFPKITVYHTLRGVAILQCRLATFLTIHGIC